MAPRTTECPANGLRVLVVDEDIQHVNYLRAVLPQYNFHVTVYTSPVMALNFLKDHTQDVDFLLVAMHMQEISGFQFLEIATKMHRNIIMMSATTTLDMMDKCIKLNARFLEEKPLGSSAIRNLWQHLDLEPSKRMEMFLNFIQDPTRKAHGEQSTITELSDDAESMNEVSSSKVGSSTDVNMGLVNNSDSKAGESKEKNPNKKPRLGN
ncbi:unnamed protein product [Urochloa decumbens]|uniref:Response regulatory domain-containing protein n=1 Tax=Urochloa decumbens TaxID=240449 RepID=A0ABC9CDM8_9POAL